MAVGSRTAERRGSGEKLVAVGARVLNRLLALVRSCRTAVAFLVRQAALGAGIIKICGRISLPDRIEEILFYSCQGALADEVQASLDVRPLSFRRMG